MRIAKVPEASCIHIIHQSNAVTHNLRVRTPQLTTGKVRECAIKAKAPPFNKLERHEKARELFTSQKTGVENTDWAEQEKTTNLLLLFNRFRVFSRKQFN